MIESTLTSVFRHGLNFIKLDGDIGCLGKHVMEML